MVFANDITLITANTTLSTKNDVYLVNASGGSITITLPNITCDGIQYKIKRTDSTSANTVTIQGNSGAQTIDGATSVSILPLTIYEVVSYSSLWYVISDTAISRSAAKTLFTMSFVQSGGNPFFIYSGNASTQTICSFYFPGSSTESISIFSCVLAMNAGTPTGTVTLTDPTRATTYATITYTGVTSTQTVFTTTSISNLPSSASVIQFNITIASPTGNKLSVYSITVQ